MKKAKLIVDGKEFEVELSEEQVKELCSDKYEIEYEKCDTWLVKETYIIKERSEVDDVYIKYGRYRHTKEQARISLNRQIRAMRLEALAMSLPEWEPNGECYVAEYKNEWMKVEKTDIAFYPEVVTMPEKCAIRVAEILNSGKYSLDV